jgi:hypothetical protein
MFTLGVLVWLDSAVLSRGLEKGERLDALRLSGGGGAEADGPTW